MTARLPSALVNRWICATLVLFALTGPAVAQRRAMLPWWNRAPALWSERYLVKTDLPVKDARAYGRHLDRMYNEYARRLAALPPRSPEKLNVYIFRTQQDYLQTLRTQWGLDGRGTGGMFFVSGQGSGLAFWTDGLPRSRVHHVIQHEGFHQFAYSRFGDDLPLWLNEGLAEFFGQAVLFDDTLILGQTTPMIVDSVRNAVEQDEHIPFRHLLSLSHAKWRDALGTTRAGLQYNQSWSMVHFLVYADGMKYQGPLEDYLKRLNAGIPPARAFTDVFGSDIDAFEKKWKAYAIAAKPSAFVTALERIEFIAEGAKELAARGTVPSSLAELKTQLEEIDFTHVINRHGAPVTLTAEDDANFEIPMDDLTQHQPEFEAAKPKLRGQSRRERKVEELQPTPSTIATKNLKPKNLTLHWFRDKETGDFRYEIVVR